MIRALPLLAAPLASWLNASLSSLILSIGLPRGAKLAPGISADGKRSFLVGSAAELDSSGIRVADMSDAGKAIRLNNILPDEIRFVEAV